MNQVYELKIMPFDAFYQRIARDIILKGFEERFGFIDETLNPDLDNIYETFIKKGDTFLLGCLNDLVVSTGGLIEERSGVGRVVRVSVLKEYRRYGLATQMMAAIEHVAREKNDHELVLETNEDWDSAIGFYGHLGYKEYARRNGQVHMVKHTDF